MIEYDKIAKWYAKTRNPEIGVPEVARLQKLLPSNAEVLDLGCGTGLPITRALVDMGFSVYGIDSSQEMVRQFRQNLPGVPVLCEPAQRSDLFGKSFDAVVSWGMLYHLDPDDQALIIEKVAERLKTGGVFLFTSGDREGVVEGEMHGVSFRYISLGSDQYRKLLEKAGLTVVDEQFDPYDNYLYVAQHAVGNDLQGRRRRKAKSKS